MKVINGNNIVIQVYTFTNKKEPVLEDVVFPGKFHKIEGSCFLTEKNHESWILKDGTLICHCDETMDNDNDFNLKTYVLNNSEFNLFVSEGKKGILSDGITGILITHKPM